MNQNSDTDNVDNGSTPTSNDHDELLHQSYRYESHFYFVNGTLHVDNMQ
eukprot:CAMPEP_0171326994 /NCGR_PEP_ID=MMETSP0816-20121228/117806_1 /TAXON_ID=420281 /ORGANISM="Proboscia inermis, Strain CCAP1064/1" /LENGTH=48 /DNA_ID= /DNA_START= /DNA_END= /DNA_ORIENTATION=